MFTISDRYKDRRFKMTYIPFWYFLSCLTESAQAPGDVIVKLSLSVPPETEVVNIMDDYQHHAVMVLLWNRMWSPVPEASQPEIIEVTRTPIQLIMGNSESRQPLINAPNASILAQATNPFDRSWKPQL